jgi:radical SAM protein with 4Fe4S-binding SPASM domain
MGSLERLTTDAKDILLELEREAQRDQSAKIRIALEEACRDPLAIYKQSKWYPRYVVWELTLACNMRCEHCGSQAGKARSDELTLDEMLHVCDELAELECERLTLLGGEPLIHPHWFDVACRIKDNGFRANVITNGWTLHKPEVCDQLKAADLSIVGVSVDGWRESHDKLRSRPGSFDRIVQGLKLLDEREMPIAISTVITNDSLQDLEQLYQLFSEHNVRVWQFQVANPLGRMSKSDPLIIQPSRLKDLYQFVTEKNDAQQRTRLDISDNVGYFGKYEEQGIRRSRQGSYFWKGCHAGIQAMGIDSNGDIKGCQSLPSLPQFVEGNIRQRPLREIWHDPNAFAYNRQFKLSDLQGFCAKCQYGPLCKAGCSSAAISHSGHIGNNPMCIYRCENEHLSS